MTSLDFSLGIFLWKLERALHPSETEPRRLAAQDFIGDGRDLEMSAIAYDFYKNDNALPVDECFRRAKRELYHFSI